MDEGQKQSTGENFVGLWFKTFYGLWQTVLNEYANTLNKINENLQNDKSQNQGSATNNKSTRLVNKNYQVMTETLQQALSAENLPQAMVKQSELLMKCMQMGNEECLSTMNDLLGQVQDSALSTGSDEYNFFENSIKAYESGLQKIINIPQLGLTRYHQERFNRLLDKFNVLMHAACEFAYYLYYPIENSLAETQNKLKSMSEDEVSDYVKDFYKLWIKTLEGEYMTLFQQPEFVSAFNKYIDCFMDFYETQNKFMESVIQFFPVSTKSEMYDLARENHQLKKRIRHLESKVEELETSIKAS